MAASSAKRLRRSTDRSRLRTTREGRVFLLVTLLVGVAAVNTGNNLLYLVLGLLLSLIVLSGVMSELAVRGVRIERRLPARAFAESTALVELALTNEKRRFASYSLEVEDLAEGEPSDRRCYFLKIAPGVTQLAAYRRTPMRRGIVKLTGFRLATRYPFGIFEKWRELDAPGELVVFPRLLPMRAELDQVRGVEREAGRVGSGPEVVGVREMRSGDTGRDVHWRRTAALGRMVVRERLREESRHLALRIEDGDPGDAAWRKELEQQLSRAASAAADALAAGASVDVVAHGGRSARVEARRAPDPIWRFLALIPPLPEAPKEPHK